MIVDFEYLMSSLVPKKPPDEGGSGTSVLTRTKTRTQRPNLYRVLLLNDDFTPMEFVIHVLQQFFNKDLSDATQIMLHVHQNGVGGGRMWRIYV